MLSLFYCPEKKRAKVGKLATSEERESEEE